MIKSEYFEQVAFFNCICKYLTDDVYEPTWWTHHIPNGGYRNKAEAGRLKAQGVLPGVSDVCNPIPSADGKYNGLYLEFKSNIGIPSVAQQAFMDRMAKAGWHVEIVRDWVKGIQLLLDHFNLPYPPMLKNVIKYPRG